MCIQDNIDHTFDSNNLNSDFYKNNKNNANEYNYNINNNFNIINNNSNDNDDNDNDNQLKALAYYSVKVDDVQIDKETNQITNLEEKKFN